MTSRREVLSWMGLGSLAGVTGTVIPRIHAQSSGHDMPDRVVREAGETVLQTAPLPAASRGEYLPVRTLNGWTLPYKMNAGVKEFHLVAEEVEHEFAPGTTAKCWGYNGSTPGPTILAPDWTTSSPSMR